jgi:hypothetical protein
MASLISGTEIAATVTDELTVEVAALKESTGGKVPGSRPRELAINRPPTVVY